MARAVYVQPKLGSPTGRLGVSVDPSSRPSGVVGLSAFAAGQRVSSTWRAWIRKRAQRSFAPAAHILGPHDEAMLDEDLRTAGRTLFATEAVYVHRWTRGEAMLFDNHRMLHSTSPIACYAQGEPRLMWQVICKAEMSFRDDQVL